MAVTVECITSPDGSKEGMEEVISPAPATANEFPGFAPPEGTGWGATDCKEGIDMALRVGLLLDGDGLIAGLMSLVAVGVGPGGICDPAGFGGV